MEMNEARTKSAMEQFGFTQEQADDWLLSWDQEHHDGETTLSYIDWLKHEIAAAQDDLINVAGQALEVLENSDRTPENDPVIEDLSHIISLVAPGLVAPAVAAERERFREEAGA